MGVEPPRQVVLRRDCVAVGVPGGEPIALLEGDVVTILQHLGRSFTVSTDQGALARLGADDADALGVVVVEGEPTEVETEGVDTSQVLDRLRRVYDPEIPVNVVDLGLIYACEVRPLEDGGYRVEIKMSMTAPGCGMGDVLREDATDQLLGLRSVREVDVELVFDPPWDLSRLSDAARLELGLL